MSIELIFGVLLALQSFAIFVDEFHFHRNRGLPRWEQIGHPLDTLTVLASFIPMAILPKSGSTPPWLIGLIIFSCLFVTKDEWVHQAECCGDEQWLHSVLFLLHPGVLYAAWLCWKESGPSVLHQIQIMALSVFFIYQVVYWNFGWNLNWILHHETESE